jgi:AraC family transcriptional regulator
MDTAEFALRGSSGQWSSRPSFHGITVRSREIAGFLLSELRYGPRASIPLHQHRTAYLGFVMDGALTARNPSAERSYQPGTAFFDPAGESHANQISRRGAHLLCIELATPAVERLRMPGLNISARAERVGGTVALLGHRLFLQHQREDSISTLVAEGLILELIAELLDAEAAQGKSSRATSWMKHAIEYMHTDFRQTISLEHIAKIAGVHPVHLARTFRRIHGCTVGEYTRRLRLEDACKKLIATEKSITELALECGFTDHSHFCHAFRRQFGAAPSRFRRAYRR